ncbi:hypothetical protein M758_10G109400 [Ceratodon purpureus]|nr:hypothetical protein M758_10G109400 [Ceratodon purpureus]
MNFLIASRAFNSIYAMVVFTVTSLPLELMKCKKTFVLNLGFNNLDGKLLPRHLYTLAKLELTRLSLNGFLSLLPEISKNNCQSLTNLIIEITKLLGCSQELDEMQKI